MHNSSPSILVTSTLRHLPSRSNANSSSSRTRCLPPSLEVVKDKNKNKKEEKPHNTRLPSRRVFSQDHGRPSIPDQWCKHIWGSNLPIAHGHLASPASNWFSSAADAPASAAPYRGHAASLRQPPAHTANSGHSKHSKPESAQLPAADLAAWPPSWHVLHGPEPVPSPGLCYLCRYDASSYHCNVTPAAHCSRAVWRPRTSGSAPHAPRWHHVPARCSLSLRTWFSHAAQLHAPRW